MSVGRIEALTAESLPDNYLGPKVSEKLDREKRHNAIGNRLSRKEICALKKLQARIEAGELKAHGIVVNQVDTLIRSGHDSNAKIIAKAVGNVTVASVFGYLGTIIGSLTGVKAVMLACSAIATTMWANLWILPVAAVAWITKKLVED